MSSDPVPRYTIRLAADLVSYGVAVEPEPDTSPLAVVPAAAYDALVAERDTFRGAYDHVDAVLNEVKAQRDALAAFKVFVHGRLDTAGVPTHFPDGPHTREGCRVGDRMDWLMDRLSRLRASLERAEQFIANGVEFGYIAMPEAGDPAHQTLPLIRAALTPDAVEGRPA